MESLQEREERMFAEIGGAMNDYFTKQQMVKFYNFLKRVNRLIIWCNMKRNFFHFDDVMYLSGRKFRVTVMNTTRFGKFNADFEEEDRYPIEICVELPIETYDNGLTNNKVVLKSKGNLLGGMSYKDFAGFLKVYKGWLRTYNRRRYHEYQQQFLDISGSRFEDEDEEYNLDNIPEETKRGFMEALSCKFGKPSDPEDEELYDDYNN